MRNEARLIVVAAVAALLVGCGEKPSSVCASAVSQDEVATLIYGALEDTVKATATEGFDAAQVLREIEAMKRERLLSFNFSTLGGVDPATKKVSCSADVKVALSAQDQTPAAVTAMQTIFPSLGVADTLSLAEVTSGTFHGGVDFSRQPNAAGDGKFVYSETNATKIIDALMLIAIERTAVHAQAASSVTPPLAGGTMPTASQQDATASADAAAAAADAAAAAANDAAALEKAQAPETDSAFAQGHTDRATYEAWYAALAGFYKDGATYWASHRSLAQSRPCEDPENARFGPLWLQGCVAARDRLAPSDVLRKTKPVYRAGWNS
jgi:hypothetical protein